MELLHTKIPKQQLNYFKENCLGYDVSHNDGHLRERIILMGLPNEEGFICVEGNTEGFFIEGKDTTLNEANSFLRGC